MTTTPPSDTRSAATPAPSDAPSVDSSSAAEQLVDSSRQLLTVKQVMAELNVARGTVYKLIREGRLRTVRISRGARRFSRAAIDDFVHEAEAESHRIAA